MPKQRIAIIGTGMAAMSLASALKDRATLTLFEKSRGMGGRLATRYHDEYQFDFGAQFMTAKTTKFQQLMQRLQTMGLVDIWRARFQEIVGTEMQHERLWDSTKPHFVAIPKMNQICKFLAIDLDVRLRSKVVAVENEKKGLRLQLENGEEHIFDFVISTAPPQQTLDIFPDAYQHRVRLQQKEMQGCFTMMLGYQTPRDMPFDAAVVKENTVSWIAQNSSKPERDTPQCIVVHATNRWADAHMEWPTDKVYENMFSTLCDILGDDFRKPDYHSLHRWRYANIPKQSSSALFIDETLKLAACGDWCIQGRVEAAHTSALLLADAMAPFLH